MITRMKKVSFFLFLVLGILLTACGKAVEQTPTMDPAAVYTQVAATIQAGIQQTQAALPSPTTAPTETPSPTATLTPEVSLTPSTPMPTLTQYVPGAGGTPSSSTGDDLKWIADVTIADCTVLSPGEEFVKTWKVQNSGTTTWSKDYYVLWLDIKNYEIGKYKDVVIESMKKIGEDVKPGNEIELDMKLVAPDTNGVYKVYYTMINPNVKYPVNHLGFGDSLWVIFVVNDTQTTPIACP